MTNQFEIDCSLMAGRAYQNTRAKMNFFPIPKGWQEFFHVPDNPDYPMFTGASGFEAVSFQNGNDIVISYAGTDITSFSDLLTDGALAAGSWSNQLRDAASYYLNVKAANPNAHITFTGHSSGLNSGARFGKKNTLNWLRCART